MMHCFLIIHGLKGYCNFFFFTHFHLSTENQSQQNCSYFDWFCLLLKSIWHGWGSVGAYVQVRGASSWGGEATCVEGFPSTCSSPLLWVCSRLAAGFNAQVRFLCVFLGHWRILPLAGCVCCWHLWILRILLSIVLLNSSSLQNLFCWLWVSGNVRRT